MPWWVWIPIGAFVAAALCAAAILLVSVISLFRRLGGLQAATAQPLERIALVTQELDVRSRLAEERSTDLHRALAELRGSLEVLSVFAWALRDVRAAIALLRGAVPEK